jgi:hypothetical protein
MRVEMVRRAAACRTVRSSNREPPDKGVREVRQRISARRRRRNGLDVPEVVRGESAAMDARPTWDLTGISQSRTHLGLWRADFHGTTRTPPLRESQCGPLYSGGQSSSRYQRSSLIPGGPFLARGNRHRFMAGSTLSILPRGHGDFHQTKAIPSSVPPMQEDVLRADECLRNRSRAAFALGKR